MWALAVSVYLTAVFHRNALAVASLAAERRFHVGPSALAGLVALQLGLYAVMQIPSGVMADRFGPRHMLAGAAALMGGGELVFAFAHGPVPALAGRGFVGLGDALTFLSVLRLVQNWFPAGRYVLLTALTGLVGGAGQLASTVPLHLGLVHSGWSPTFAATALVTLAVGVPMWLRLRDRPGDAVAGRVPSPRGRGVTVGALREVACRSGTWRGLWAHFGLTGAYAVFTVLWGYPFLVGAARYSASRASEALAVVVSSSIVAAPLTGTTMARMPASRVPLVYTTATTIVASWVVALALGAAAVPGWLVVVILVSTGVASPVSAAAFDLAREANRPEHGGAATGVVNIGGFSAAVLADIAIGTLLATAGHGGRRPGDFEWPMACIPAMVTVGMTGFWWCGRSHRWCTGPGRAG